MFAFLPGLLLIEAGADPIIVDLLSCFAAALMLSVSMRGYMLEKVPWWLRVSALISGLLFITDAKVTNTIAIGICVAVIGLHFLTHSRNKNKPLVA